MTAEEFQTGLDGAREVIRAFLSVLPRDTTVGEVLDAVNAEKPSEAEIETAFQRLNFGPHLN